MAWVKIPAENHLLFRAALPADARIATLTMFGGVAAKANGHMFGGTFGRSVMLMLSDADRATALALDGAAPFDPMGNGAMRGDKVQMPEALMDDAHELKEWVGRAFAYAVTLPAKPEKTAAKKAAPKKAAPAKTAEKAKRQAAKPKAAKPKAAKPKAAKPKAAKPKAARPKAAKAVKRKAKPKRR